MSNIIQFLNVYTITATTFKATSYGLDGVGHTQVPFTWIAIGPV
jgi:hypothetical protein